MLVIALLVCLISVAQSAVSVTGSLRNEFGNPMVLVSAQLGAGDWVTPPTKSIAPGTTYNNIFVASGASAVSGTITYKSDLSTTLIYFSNGPAQIYNISVNPPPWIGGIGSKVGTSAVTYQYWTHQMCFSSEHECAKKLFWMKRKRDGDEPLGNPFRPDPPSFTGPRIVPSSLDGYDKVEGGCGIFISNLSDFPQTVREKGITHFAALILLNRTILGQALETYGVLHTFYEADNVWAILPSGKDATLAALEAARLVSLHNQQFKETIKLTGVGIDAGTNVFISREDGKFYGDCVTRAFKIGEDTTDSEVVVTDNVYKSIKDLPEFKDLQGETKNEIKESHNLVFTLKGKISYSCSLTPWRPEGESSDLIIQRLMPNADIPTLDREIKSKYLTSRVVMVFGHDLHKKTTESFLGLLSRLCSETDPIIRNYNGKPVESCFSVFGNVYDAINSCVRIREKMKQINKSIEQEENKIKISGFGIHIGELLWIPETTIHWGDPVITASKLGKELGREGEILLSDVVYEMVKDDLPKGSDVESKKCSGVLLNAFSIPQNENFGGQDLRKQNKK